MGGHGRTRFGGRQDAIRLGRELNTPYWRKKKDHGERIEKRMDSPTEKKRKRRTPESMISVHSSSCKEGAKGRKYHISTGGGADVGNEIMSIGGVGCSDSADRLRLKYF